MVFVNIGLIVLLYVKLYITPQNYIITFCNLGANYQRTFTVKGKRGSNTKALYINEHSLQSSQMSSRNADYLAGKSC